MTRGRDIDGPLAAIALGIAAIGLECKGFTPKGLPWSTRRHVTGRLGEIRGAISMLIGAAFICFALLALSKEWN